MCLAIPMKLEKIEQNNMGIVEIGGVRRQVGLHMLPEAKPGDYLIVHAGFAIQKLDEKEALKTLALIEEMGKVI